MPRNSIDDCVRFSMSVSSVPATIRCRAAPAAAHSASVGRRYPSRSGLIVISSSAEEIPPYTGARASRRESALAAARAPYQVSPTAGCAACPSTTDSRSSSARSPNCEPKSSSSNPMSTRGDSALVRTSPSVTSHRPAATSSSTNAETIRFVIG